MRLIHIIKLALLLSVTMGCISPAAYAASPIRTIEGYISKVSDGDTVQVVDDLGTKIKVRFYGMDAPETEKKDKRTGKVIKPGQPFGEEAFRALQSKLEKQRVRLDVMGTDRYRRLVCVIWVEDRNIEIEMIREGWAWAYRKYLDAPYASEYIGAEERAKKERKGLWVQKRPQPPWVFRKSLKKQKQFAGEDA